MPHDVLLHKLSSLYNVTGDVWYWIRSFLSGRQQRVQYKGYFSSRSSPTSGIPQGSVLGPCLFNLFINDLPRYIDSSCALFADDTVISRPMCAPVDHQYLQNDIDSIHQWCQDNKMCLNASKSKVMRISCAKNPGIPEYSINSILLDVVTETKYLGVMINNRLSWDSHVNYIVSRANRLLGLLSSVSSGLSSHATLCLYKALILPILEYGLPVWTPYTKNVIGKIEGIQGRATRIILKQRRMEMSYEERLRRLRWSSLDSRRKYTLITFIIKCLFMYVSCDSVNSAINVNPRYSTDLKF